jgi:hypothetical protein
LRILCQFLGSFNVFVLSRLVATTEKQNQNASALYVINPIAGAVMDAQLAYSVANRLHIAGIAEGEPLNPRSNFGFRSGIAERLQPC